MLYSFISSYSILFHSVLFFLFYFISFFVNYILPKGAVFIGICKHNSTFFGNPLAEAKTNALGLAKSNTLFTSSVYYRDEVNKHNSLVKGWPGWLLRPR